jgi:light-regulated signal transduction histidine kinase (bacteriophytochrome)
MTVQKIKNYDSDFCGSVPLNFINQIQPYGLLLVVQKEGLNILQASMNSAKVLGIEAEELVNTSLNTYLNNDQLNSLDNRFKPGINRLPMRFSFNTNGKQVEFLAIVHAKDEYYILELEEIQNNSLSSFIDIYQEIKYSMTAIDNATTLDEVCKIALAELKRISGFDRIMIYQFDNDWNGTVIAETLEGGMEPYLNLRFPASDVPKQARALYHKNPYRQIPDREYSPEKLYPILNPLTNAFTDLSDCNMRGVATVHLEYLKNMAVACSMSTRILKDNKLWGLISCHHRTPKFLGYQECAIFELLSEVISSKLSSLQNADNFEVKTKLQDVQARLVEQIYSSNGLVEGITQHETNILDLLKSDSAAILYDKEIITVGNTPDKNDISELAILLQSKNIDKVMHTSELSEMYENALNYSNIASGIIVVPINADKGEYIIGFRPELIKKVDWGGNPNEAINFEADNKNYHPRNSFKLWQQTVKHTSQPWHEEEVAIAENFRNVLLEYTFKKVYA